MCLVVRWHAVVLSTCLPAWLTRLLCPPRGAHRHSPGRGSYLPHPHPSSSRCAELQGEVCAYAGLGGSCSQWVSSVPQIDSFLVRLEWQKNKISSLKATIQGEIKTNCWKIFVFLKYSHLPVDREQNDGDILTQIGVLHHTGPISALCMEFLHICW